MEIFIMNWGTSNASKRSFRKTNKLSEKKREKSNRFASWRQRSTLKARSHSRNFPQDFMQIDLSESVERNDYFSMVFPRLAIAANMQKNIIKTISMQTLMSSVVSGSTRNSRAVANCKGKVQLRWDALAQCRLRHSSFNWQSPCRAQ